MNFVNIFNNNGDQNKAEESEQEESAANSTRKTIINSLTRNSLMNPAT